VSNLLNDIKYITDTMARLEWWSQRMACTNKTEETLNDGKVQHESWACDGKDGMLQHYKINDLGKY
jgi:hypothetical protein